MRLLAGDVGAKTTRLALVSAEAGPRRFVAQRAYPSAKPAGLKEVVETFLADPQVQAAGHPTSACFCVAVPMIDGRAHLTRVPWDLSGAGLKASLAMARLAPMNDLKAMVHAALLGAAIFGLEQAARP